MYGGCFGLPSPKNLLGRVHVTNAQNKKYLGQESCRTKVSRIFRIFVPNFAPNFDPNFPRIFRGFFVLRFVGDGDQKKFTKNPRHFSMQNSQANTEKIFTKFFWRAGKVKNIEQDQKGYIQKGFPWKGQISLLLGQRIVFGNRPDRGHPFCGDP